MDRGGQVCAKGTYRNASLSYCEPCPSGTFAATAGSTACAPCSSTQLCPVATSEPIDVSDFKALISQTIADALAAAAAGLEPAQPGAARRRGLLATRRLLGAGDFFKRLASDEQEMKFTRENVTYDTNSATIVRPEISTEEVAKQRLYRIFALLVSCVGVVLILAGMCLYSYLKVPLAVAPSERHIERDERKKRRAERILKLDRLYTGQIAAKRQQQQAKLGEPAADDAAKKAEEEAAEEEERATVYGVVFTMVGIGLAAIAAGYVLLQFSIANFSIIQTLQPGASPSAADIAGPLNVTAFFTGFSGPCQLVQRAGESAGNASRSRFDGRAGVDVFVSGIGPVDGSPPPTAEASYIASRRTCLVSWRCSRCRLLAASNVTVDFRLVTRLALAVAVNYAIHVPSNLSIEGVIVPSSQAEFSVFRGTAPVTVPVSLFPLHFEDERDGTPRYDAALRLADNRATEKGEASFALCSFTKPLSDPECAGESVNFRVLFNVDNIYVMARLAGALFDSRAPAADGAGRQVYRKVKASIADMLADLSALTQTAIGVGGQIAVALLTAQYFMKNRLAGRQSSRDTLGGSSSSAASVASSSEAGHAKPQAPGALKAHAASFGSLTPSGPSGASPPRPGSAAPRMHRRWSTSNVESLDNDGVIDIYDAKEGGGGPASRGALQSQPLSPSSVHVSLAAAGPGASSTSPRAGAHVLPRSRSGSMVSLPPSAARQPVSPGPSTRYAYNIASATLPIPNLPARPVSLIDLSGSRSASIASGGSASASGSGSLLGQPPAAAAAAAGTAAGKDDAEAAAPAIHVHL
eukprot:tig00000241_g21034.t1